VLIIVKPEQKATKKEGGKKGRKKEEERGKERDERREARLSQATQCSYLKNIIQEHCLSESLANVKLILKILAIGMCVVVLIAFSSQK
jgi:hypothetical protein